MQLGRFKSENWRLMLIERKRLVERGDKFSMYELLESHSISKCWAKQIEPAVAFFAKQKRSREIPMVEFFMKVKELYALAHKKDTPEITVPVPTKEVVTTSLEKVSLEDLIKEINRRGFKVAQV